MQSRQNMRTINFGNHKCWAGEVNNVLFFVFVSVFPCYQESITPEQTDHFLCLWTENWYWGEIRGHYDISDIFA